MVSKAFCFNFCGYIAKNEVALALQRQRRLTFPYHKQWSGGDTQVMNWWRYEELYYHLICYNNEIKYEELDGQLQPTSNHFLDVIVAIGVS